jgi:hypothetical protein
MRWYAMSDFAMSTAVSAGVGQLARRFVFGATDLYFIDGGDGIATLPK